MPRYKLRTLMIVLAFLPPIIAWWGWPAIKAWLQNSAIKSPAILSRFIVIDEHQQELDRQAAAAKSKELGAPQPLALPDGYGEKPVEQ
jgi:hypothetical protein